MRFYWQGAVHPWARWFCVGGVFIGNRRISLAITRHICKFVRDDAGWDSWSVFFLFLRLHFRKTKMVDCGDGNPIVEIAAKNMPWNKDPDWPVV